MTDYTLIQVGDREKGKKMSKKKYIVGTVLLLCCFTAVLFIANLSGKAHASMPSFDASIFEGVNTLVISVGPTPSSKDYPFSVSQEELTDMVLDHFKKKFADHKGGIKVVYRGIWRSKKHSDDEYNAGLHLYIFISWRDIEGFGKEGKPDIAAVGVKIMRHKVYIGSPHGSASNYVSDAIPAPFLVSEDKDAFRGAVLGAIDETTDWFVPWLTCHKSYCGESQSPYHK